MPQIRHSLRLRHAIAASAVAIGGLSLTACSAFDDSSSGGTDGDGNVVVGFYPLEYLATTIAGDEVEVQSLAQPGADPHDMELAPRQVAAVSSASLVVYLKGLQPPLDEAIKNEKPAHVLDVSTVAELIEGEGHSHDHGDEEHANESPAGDEHAGESHAEDEHASESAASGTSADDHAHDHGDETALDPHIWLDPHLMLKMADAVKDELVDIFPEDKDAIEANHADLASKLEKLDTDFHDGLAQCQSTSFVTTHTAFSYLANAYGLQQVGITGLADEDPSPQKLAEVQQFVEQNGVTTIFFESGSADKHAETVASATGAKTDILYTLENAPESGDYLSAMEHNLQALRTALGCA